MRGRLLGAWLMLVFRAHTRVEQQDSGSTQILADDGQKGSNRITSCLE